MLLGKGALEEALVLGRVELSVGLEVGSLHQLRGWAKPCRLKDFVVCYSDAPPSVFLAEEGIANELVVGLVHQSLSLVERDALIAALRLLLLEILCCLVPGGRENVFTVYRGHRGGGRYRRSAKQA